VLSELKTQYSDRASISPHPIEKTRQQNKNIEPSAEPSPEIIPYTRRKTLKEKQSKSMKQSETTAQELNQEPLPDTPRAKRQKHKHDIENP